jgi:hypothetical protein
MFVIVMITGWSVGHAAAGSSGTVQVASTAPTHLYLTVATPDMLQSDVGPAVLPSVATVPANSDVTVTIINFDDVTPLTGAYVKYAKATGIVGKFSTETMDKANPNGPPTDSSQTVSEIDPALVSHTFTIPALNLNVPLLASSRTTFTFHTGAAGTFEWHCQDPCGTGPAGWSGAMSQQGYMGGRLTVT